MPVGTRDDGKPVVEFDPRLEISPFTLFRRLDEGRPVLLIDVRTAGPGKTLRGSQPLPSGDWQPPADRDVVLFDNDGSAALKLAARFQAVGHSRVRALFGGLELYEFSLDPEVVGADTYLVSTESSGGA